MTDQEKCKGLGDNIQGLLMQTTHRYHSMCFPLIDELGVHPGQIPILKVLHMNPGLSQKELAQMLSIKPPTVNVTVKRLEKAGYVRRETDQTDQRTTRIYLTEQGNSINEKIMDFVYKTEEVITRDFSESELCLLRRFLRQLHDNMDAMEKKE